MKYSIVLITFFCLSFTSDNGKYYSSNKKKADKKISKLWEEETLTLSPIPFTKGDLEKAGVKKVELYKLNTTSKKDLGFVYFTEAPSKVETFTFMVVFNPDLTIFHTVVLKYRENYGAEICSKRFLKQFKNKKNGINLEFEKDIDGISGATISAKSITRSIKMMSKNIIKLKNNNLI